MATDAHTQYEVYNRVVLQNDDSGTAHPESGNTTPHGTAITNGNAPQTGSGRRWFLSWASRTDVAIVVAFCISNFFVQAFYSLMTPFYPDEAVEVKSVRPVIMGLVISIYEAALVLTAPLLGRFITEIGAKFMFITGHFACGVCSILFGTLVWCPPGDVYVALSLIIRVLEGASSAAINTASFAIIGFRFPERVATLFGMLETFCGLGMMLGPALGSLLYKAGGFWVPFVTCGALLVVVGAVSILLVPSMHVVDDDWYDQRHRDPRASTTGLLSNPLVCIIGLNVMMGSAAIGFMTATLEPQLKNVFHISEPLYIGLICTAGPLCYMLLAPLWGYLSDKVFRDSSARLVISGYVVVAVSFWFMGPAPLFHIDVWGNDGKQGHLALLVAAQAVLGGAVAAFVVTFRMIARLARDKFTESFATFGVVSGVFNAFFSWGAFVGPLLGSWLAGRPDVGFTWGTFIMGCLVLVSAVLLSMFTGCQRCCCTERGGAYGNDDGLEEERPLLSHIFADRPAQ